MSRGCSISCHDEIVSNENLAEEAGKDVEQIQYAADSCVNLRPIVDLLVGHSMPLELRYMGVRIDKASTVEIVREASTPTRTAFGKPRIAALDLPGPFEVRPFLRTSEKTHLFFPV
jgi:hypothetical protein